MSIKKLINKTLYHLPEISSVLNVFGSIVFVILVILAHIYVQPSSIAIQFGFPVEYSWQQLELSELVLYGETSELIFNLAVILYGSLLIIPLLSLCLIIKKTSLRILYISMAIFNCLFLIGIGVFSEDHKYNLHFLFAFLFFITTIGCFILISSVLLNYQTISKLYPFFGFFTAAFYLFYLISRNFFGKGYTQRLAILFSISCLLAINIRLTFGNEYKNLLEQKQNNKK